MQDDLNAFLFRQGLAATGSRPRWTALAGGVSSDIWRVDLENGESLCVKRALSRLKVAADWQAPTSRNAYEWAWLCLARKFIPDAVPEPLAHDPQEGLFAMRFLEPRDHPVWKQQLLSGHVTPGTAASVGECIGIVHASTAFNTDIAQQFSSDGNFYALRLEPYLVATATRHAIVSRELMTLANETASHRVALVHGDVSPKNILVGPAGPILLDAECAWYGDPAFDPAFCLNHFLLKAVLLPSHGPALLTAFSAFVSAYFTKATFEPRQELDRRIAKLLPGLFLARVDGKSPVEYLDQEDQRQTVREIAIPLLIDPPESLTELSERCFSVLCSRH
ncbi:MAG: aminoglycoside phosphotransferase family protein [Burkholderiaceae bacterium]|nr:aminoglycoside phosphotransferase family protein [Burkholderiaceae bacterium]